MAMRRCGWSGPPDARRGVADQVCGETDPTGRLGGASEEGPSSHVPTMRPVLVAEHRAATVSRPPPHEVSGRKYL
jgi:hypothetical protein